MATDKSFQVVVVKVEVLVVDRRLPVADGEVVVHSVVWAVDAADVEADLDAGVDVVLHAGVEEDVALPLAGEDVAPDPIVEVVVDQDAGVVVALPDQDAGVDVVLLHAEEEEDVVLPDVVLHQVVETAVAPVVDVLVVAVLEEVVVSENKIEISLSENYETNA